MDFVFYTYMQIENESQLLKLLSCFPIYNLVRILTPYPSVLAVKIQFVELDFSNLIFQKSSTDGS